jgi:TDG/mug DNA glycosylase family protein
VVSVGQADTVPVNHRPTVPATGSLGRVPDASVTGAFPDAGAAPVATEAPVAPVAGGATWTWTVPDVDPERLPLVFHRAQRPLEVGTTVDLRVRFAEPLDRLVALIRGAGFTVVPEPVVEDDGTVRVRLVRERTLADTVGPGMRLLICGVNPSVYSADAGVGYARPGNRFWPAVLAAGLAQVDRDPVAALAGGMGMTDFAKRATRTAAEVTRGEYASGFARVTALVEWLRPGTVCFVGLSGWRTVVDRHAVAGPQPTPIGGRPAYVMPSTSGLNARTPLSELVAHLTAARELPEANG